MLVEFLDGKDRELARLHPLGDVDAGRPREAVVLTGNEREERALTQGNTCSPRLVEHSVERFPIVAEDPFGRAGLARMLDMVLIRGVRFGAHRDGYICRALSHIFRKSAQSFPVSPWCISRTHSIGLR
jgi:hypothetical protein